MTSLGEKPLEIKTGDTARLRAWLEPNPDEPTALAAGKKNEPTAVAAGMKPNVQPAEPKPASNTVDSPAVPTGLPKPGTWEPDGPAGPWARYPGYHAGEAESLPGLAIQPARLPGVRRWNVETRLPRSPAPCAEFSPDGKYVAIASIECQTRIYDATTLELVHILPGVGRTAYTISLDWHPSGKAIVVTRGLGPTIIWQLSDGGRTVSDLTTVGGCQHAQFSPDGELLATISTGKLEFWNLQGQNIKTVDQQDFLCEFSRLRWSPDGQLLAACDTNGSIWLWERSGELLRTLHANSKPAGKYYYPIEWSPDGQWICTVDPGDGTQMLRHRPDGTQGDSVKLAKSGTVAHFRWAPDGSRIFASGPAVWSIVDVETGLVDHHAGNPDNSGIDVSADGTRLVTLGDNHLRILNTSSGVLTESGKFTGPFGLTH